MGLGGLYVASCWSRGRAFRNSYDALLIGQTREEISRLFDREPDITCGYADSEILYFFGSRFLVNCKKVWVRGKVFDGTPQQLPRTAETKEDIPYVYSAAQLLCDEQGATQSVCLG